ncbi:MAG: hypothetical protein H0U92_01680 [Actinobacteria bacterium]|nr:hypothetical protein [Actinomycetota bacterium]
MDGFTLTHDDDGATRIGWGEPDWLGPIRSNVADEVTASIEQIGDRVAVLRLEATRDMTGIANGDFADPTNYWSFATDERFANGVPEGATGFGFQYCEFAMPTITDASLQGWFLFPLRPSLVLPMMLIAPDRRTMLIAPLNSFHEQVMHVEDGLRCGWHGDLDRVPEGFITELAIWGASTPRQALYEWGDALLERNQTVRPGRYADDVNCKPSYWTDNGAAYWYKTEPGYDVTGTLVATVDDLRDRGVPFSTVQLDSWFYPHETLRPFDTAEWVVPPSGLMKWDARADILPDGVAALRARLGNPTLTTHCRHLAASSPYVAEFDCWVDGERAHPKRADLYELWLNRASEWGVETFEHDWLIECFLGVRGLREEPGRARAWQEGVDFAAKDRGMTLQWCMPSPADICQTVSLSRVTSIRTSGDHGYLVSAGYLWAWFLYVNAFADALGLRPYKDVFHADPTDDNAHSDVESLLSALSTGPVGIGDRLGRTDPAIVRRTCRADGMLVKPDTPIAAVDRSFLRWATRHNTLMVATSVTAHKAGKWVYAVTLNCTDARAVGRVELADLGVTDRVAVWDWRAQTLEVLDADGGWDLSLDSLDWDYRVIAPIVDGVAVIGDPALYATAGDMRIASVENGRVVLLGAGESVELVTWSEADGVKRVAVDVPAEGAVDVSVI